MAWATKEQARAHWADAVSLSDAVLDTLLDVATDQCRAYAPATPEPLPVSFMLATVYQAREVYSASQRDGDVIGVGDYAIRARPLTGTVRALLRPQMIPMAVG